MIELDYEAVIRLGKEYTVRFIPLSPLFMYTHADKKREDYANKINERVEKKDNTLDIGKETTILAQMAEDGAEEKLKRMIVDDGGLLAVARKIGALDAVLEALIALAEAKKNEQSEN